LAVSPIPTEHWQPQCRRTIRCTGAAKLGGFTMDDLSSPPRDRWRYADQHETRI
jgi:hypothetical protein